MHAVHTQLLWAQPGQGMGTLQPSCGGTPPLAHRMPAARPATSIITSQHHKPCQRSPVMKHLYSRSVRERSSLRTRGWPLLRASTAAVLQAGSSDHTSWCQGIERTAETECGACCPQGGWSRHTPVSGGRKRRQPRESALSRAAAGQLRPRHEVCATFSRTSGAGRRPRLLAAPAPAGRSACGPQRLDRPFRSLTCRPLEARAARRACRPSCSDSQGTGARQRPANSASEAAAGIRQRN